MKKEHKTVAYDETLQIEAYRLDRITQPFPNHFHEYYVIGFVARGGALLTCKNREFHVNTGNVVLFQPGDNHGRVKIDESTMDYWGLNIPQETMLTLTEEVTGKRELPGFTVNEKFSRTGGSQRLYPNETFFISNPVKSGGTSPVPSSGRKLVSGSYLYTS